MSDPLLSHSGFASLIKGLKRKFSGSESLSADDQARTNFLRAVRKRIVSAMNCEKEITRRMNGHAMAIELSPRSASEAIASSYLLTER